MNRSSIRRAAGQFSPFQSNSTRTFLYKAMLLICIKRIVFTKKRVYSFFSLQEDSMSYSRFSIASASPSGLHRMQFARKLTVIFCCSLIACLLAACGASPAASSQPSPTLTPTPTFIPTPTDTPGLTPTPTPQPPTPTPQPPAPTQPPPAPILDVAPSSMSIVGHLDCSRTTSVFVCQAAVISGASNQTTLHWVAFANISGVRFIPSQGSLSPGTRVILTIKIPVYECSGTFFFRGPVNTHTISWQC
jgi:hypothetical protein